MDGLTFQTHTVYRDRQSGSLLLMIHHNPMALSSLVLTPDDSGGFDAAHPRRADVDTIIAMRKSGQFEELDPLPDQELRSLLDELAKHVPAEELPFIQALIEQLKKQ